LQVPEKVRHKAATSGEAGRRWLADLPRQVADIERRWAITVGQPSRNGTEAFVAEARTHDGQDVVLKLVIPGADPARQELRVLHAAQGRGYARLIRADEAENVLLLERLGPQLHALHLSESRQMEIICATLHEAWMPPPEGPPFTTGADRAAELVCLIGTCRSSSEAPCSSQTIDRALSCAETRRRAFNPAQSVLVHGDAHQWNTLVASGSITGFKFIDPDGAFAEPAFDLAIPMREWGSVLPTGDLLELGRQRCRLLAKFSGVERQPIWEWAIVQCVSNGILLTQVGAYDAASVEFAMADAWAPAGIDG
jgi:streptomycin 6-kinase